VFFTDISFVDRRTLLCYTVLSVWDLEVPASNCDFSTGWFRPLLRRIRICHKHPLFDCTRKPRSAAANRNTDHVARKLP